MAKFPALVNRTLSSIPAYETTITPDPPEPEPWFVVLSPPAPPPEPEFAPAGSASWLYVPEDALDTAVEHGPAAPGVTFALVPPPPPEA